MIKKIEKQETFSPKITI